MPKTLTIACSQHPVSSTIEKNLQYVLLQAEAASKHKADIIQFPECNLTGYPGIDFGEYSVEMGRSVHNALQIIRAKAARLKLKLIVGGHYQPPGQQLPFNSLFLIGEKGDIEHRYDKRILAGAPGTSDRRHYHPGDKAVTFELKGIPCGLLICHEWRYPELYREYQQQGARIIFQSWYDGNLSKKEYLAAGKELGSLILGTVRGNAANNYLWISGSNTSARESAFSSFLVRPDGKVVSKLPRNRAGLLVNHIDLEQKFEDPSFYGRKTIQKIEAGSQNKIPFV